MTAYGHEIILTSGSHWTVPADWDSSDNEIDVIGGGGGGGNGTSQTSGGGGAFSAVYDVNLTPGQTINYGVGQGGQGGGLVANDSLGNNGYAGGQNGGDTWFGGNGYSSAIVAAKGGQGGAANTSSGAPGGQASQGIGTLKTSGGTGTYNYVPPDVSSGAGGGGAGGPNGNGGDGGQVLTAVAINSDSGAAGGGAGDGGQNGGAAISGSGDGSAGGASITGAPGGAGGKASSPNGQPGTNGSGGGGGYGDFATGITGSGGAGGNGTEWGAAGSGGGGGSGGGSWTSQGGFTGANGGLYGGGGGGGVYAGTYGPNGPTSGGYGFPGGNGAQGVIVIEYGAPSSSSGGGSSASGSSAGGSSGGGSSGGGSSGTTVLDLSLSEDAWKGDAQFTVSVDGKQVGGVMSAHALHSTGDAEHVQLTGNWGSGAHTVAVTFLNDAYGGSPSTDRNLYVNSIALNGTQYANTSGPLYSDGTETFNIGGSAATATAASNALTLHLSEDAWQGDAQFQISVDGKTITTPDAVTALHSAGAVENFTITGLSKGTHDVGVTFLNDAYGGTPSTDRNLYVNSIDYGSHHFATNAALFSDGTQHFTVS